MIIVNDLNEPLRHLKYLNNNDETIKYNITNVRIDGGSNFTVGAGGAEVKTAGFGINF
ncbi:36689_t:CDS:2, partial [Gigaspora margarita]